MILGVVWYSLIIGKLHPSSAVMENRDIKREGHMANSGISHRKMTKYAVLSRVSASTSASELVCMYTKAQREEKAHKGTR